MSAGEVAFAVGGVALIVGIWSDWRETRRNEACRRALVARTEKSIADNHASTTTKETP